ncbi:MAG: hypothetical protein ACPGUC_11020, partial [Gammaproteobacteria bacterium]
MVDIVEHRADRQWAGDRRPIAAMHAESGNNLGRIRQPNRGAVDGAQTVSLPRAHSRSRGIYRIDQCVVQLNEGVMGKVAAGLEECRFGDRRGGRVKGGTLEEGIQFHLGRVGSKVEQLKDQQGEIEAARTGEGGGLEAVTGSERLVVNSIVDMGISSLK